VGGADFLSDEEKCEMVGLGARLELIRMWNNSQTLFIDYPYLPIILIGA
jgi:hypothetical protein